MKCKGCAALALVSVSLFGCTVSPAASSEAPSSSGVSSSALPADETPQGEYCFGLGDAYVNERGDSAVVEGIALSDGKLTVTADVECASVPDSDLEVPRISFTAHYGAAENLIPNLLSSAGLDYSISWIYGYGLDAASTNALYGGSLVSDDGLSFALPSLSGEVSFVFDADADLAEAVGTESLSGAEMFLLSPLCAPSSNLTYWWVWTFADISVG